MMRWSLDSQGQITHTSDDWKSFTGLNDHQTVGRNPSPACHPDDQQSVAGIIRTAAETRSAFLITFRLLQANSHYVWVMAGASPAFKPANGNFFGYLGTTELLTAAPNPPRVMDALRGSPYRSRHQIVMLDAMADHVMTARRIAKHGADPSMERILDFALLSIGDLLYKASRG